MASLNDAVPSRRGGGAAATKDEPCRSAIPLSLPTTVPSIAASGRSVGSGLAGFVGLTGTERRVAGTIGIAFLRIVSGAKGVSGGMGGNAGTDEEAFMTRVGWPVMFVYKVCCDLLRGSPSVPRANDFSFCCCFHFAQYMYPVQ